MSPSHREELTAQPGQEHSFAPVAPRATPPFKEPRIHPREEEGGSFPAHSFRTQCVFPRRRNGTQILKGERPAVDSESPPVNGTTGHRAPVQERLRSGLLHFGKSKLRTRPHRGIAPATEKEHRRKRCRIRVVPFDPKEGRAGQAPPNLGGWRTPVVRGGNPPCNHQAAQIQSFRHRPSLCAFFGGMRVPHTRDRRVICS